MSQIAQSSNTQSGPLRGARPIRTVGGASPRVIPAPLIKKQLHPGRSNALPTPSEPPSSAAPLPSAPPPAPLPVTPLTDVRSTRQLPSQLTPNANASRSKPGVSDHTGDAVVGETSTSTVPIVIGPPIHQALERDVRPWLDLIEGLRREGVQEDLPLPQIAVMGDQSSGKSSVLEALSGVQLPRGSGLVTRCPICLTMSRAAPGQPWRAKAYLQWNNARRATAANRSQIDVASPAELTCVITTLMDEVTGGNKDMLSSDTIVVEMSGADLPDLTLIDLPGIVRTRTAGQSEGVIRDVNTLIQDYLDQERTIILCVIPSNVDISTIDILERASKVDPSGDRTIGVLTKPDLINPGGEDEVLAVANNVRKPLKLGYIMVKNRNQQQLNQLMTLKDAHAKELEFFESHEVFCALPKPQLGVGSLARKLTTVLVTQIQADLPHMKHEVMEKLATASRELQDLKDPLPCEPSKCRSAVMHLITRYSKVLRDSIKGDYREAVLSANADGRVRSMAENSFRAIQASIQSTRPNFSHATFLESLGKEVAALRGRELPGFSNSVFFHGYVLTYIEQWRRIVDGTRATMFEAVKHAAFTLMPSICPNYPRLADATKDVVVSVFTELEPTLDASLDEVFEREHDPFTLTDDLAMAIDKVRFQRFDGVVDQVVEVVKKEPNFREGGKAIQTILLHKLGVWYMANHGADFSAKVEDQRTVLQAYFNVCSKRVLDNVCMVLEKKLLAAVADNVVNELVNVIQCKDEQAILELFMEDEQTMARRAAWKEQERRLNAALELIHNVAPNCVATPRATNEHKLATSPQDRELAEVTRGALVREARRGSTEHEQAQVAGTSGHAGMNLRVLQTANVVTKASSDGPLAVFHYRHTGDNGGLIYWLGTDGLTQAGFRNPMDDNKVVVKSSGLMKGMDEASVVSRKRVSIVTKDGQDSWISLELLGGRALTPTHYTLCNGASESGVDMEGWSFEAWCDQQRSWVVLDPPSPSLFLSSPYGANTFQIAYPDGQRYSIFRVRSCHPNSLGNHSLAISAIELYGKLY